MTKKILSLLPMLFCVLVLQAQKIKVDGVAVVVGENIVLESDVAKFKQEVYNNSEGKVTMSDCEMLEQIMLQKLLAHHAVVDSVIVSDAEIESGVERNIAYLKQQLGSVEKVYKMYGFDDEADLRKELLRIERENTLIQREKQNVVSEVNVTPEEVRVYFRSLESQNNLPEFGAEIEMAQIVMHIKPSEKENQEVIDKLKGIRQDILNGSSMRMKAVLYSEDPGVTQNGGKYTLTRESQFVKEFKEVAFSLDEGEVSEPFKSDFGYHIIHLEKIKGQELDVRHILIQPKVTQEKLKEAEEKITQIRDSILADELTFEKAVIKYSQDKGTRQNKGIIINPQTNDANFELTRMDPSLYGRVSSLSVGDITEPFYDETREGLKMFKLIVLREKREAHTADFTRDYVKIQQMTLQKKQEDAMEKWYNDHVVETFVKINESNKSCDYKYLWGQEL
ncbi:peptidylprolyl isomerase [Flavicella sp.]|uniref:peptidylprolyl isomerase n=1 Tax=Flavicella sp. TaxID=2957742 RepID=UPI002630DA20|nr:peptidylprolyl isomerase [Flavicella sp.]MDG1805970.1 peptidylprolyl isomerase [Flavicella sp.]MDG2280873.1 peptidylprolyl isomerase [Flavicella sp.]